MITSYVSITIPLTLGATIAGNLKYLNLSVAKNQWVHDNWSHWVQQLLKTSVVLLENILLSHLHTLLSVLQISYKVKIIVTQVNMTLLHLNQKLNNIVVK